MIGAVSFFTFSMFHLFTFVLHAQDEVVRLKDAAVTEPSGLAAGGELHEAAALLGIDGKRDAFFATDDIAIGGGYVPDAPGNTVIDH